MNEYKYQDIFDEHDLHCDCLEKRETIDTIAYRWVINPIESEKNFLPNIKYDQINGSARRINDFKDYKKCGYCAISLFLSKDSALEKFMGIPKRSRDLMGYTAIAEGKITENDGVISDLENWHFNFYEYKDVDLKSRFVIITSM